MSLLENVFEREPATIKDQFSKDVDTDHNAEAKDGKTLFQSALQSVERRFRISQSVKQQVEDEYLDFEIVRNLKMDEAESLEGNDEDAFDAQQFIEDGLSARLSTLRKKTEVSQTVHASILQGIDVLTTVAERSDQVTQYLTKLESEIERLEGVEASFHTLRDASAKLAQDHRNQSAELTELKHTVHEVEAQNSAIRVDLQSTRMQMDRDADEKQRLEDEIAMKQATIEKLESGKTDLLEQIDAWEQSHAELKRKNYDAMIEIEKLSESMKEKDNKISRQNVASAEADRLIEQQRVELADIRAKFENASADHVATKVKLKEARAKLEAERQEHEAKASLQLKRITELAAQNQVLNRRVGFGGEKASDLKHQLKAGATVTELKPAAKKRAAAKKPVQTKACKKKSVH